jgi:hypothetical protein
VLSERNGIVTALTLLSVVKVERGRGDHTPNEWLVSQLRTERAGQQHHADDNGLQRSEEVSAINARTASV